jgi:hypothetical protein
MTGTLSTDASMPGALEKLSEGPAWLTEHAGEVATLREVVAAPKP